MKNEYVLCPVSGCGGFYSERSLLHHCEHAQTLVVEHRKEAVRLKVEEWKRKGHVFEPCYRDCWLRERSCSSFHHRCKRKGL